jgi:hypothetical protein
LAIGSRDELARELVLLLGMLQRECADRGCTRTSPPRPFEAFLARRAADRDAMPAVRPRESTGRPVVISSPMTSARWARRSSSGGASMPCSM